jgi:hypothetical protein
MISKSLVDIGAWRIPTLVPVQARGDAANDPRAGLVENKSRKTAKKSVSDRLSLP